MAKLIGQLKKEHAAISDLLDRVRDSNISSAEAHRLLMEAEKMFLAHLAKEDDELYPVLKEASLQNEALKNTVEFYMEDIEQVSREATAFFQKYSAADAPIDMEFAKAFGKFLAMLVRRIRSEETNLYRVYERLMC